MVGFCCLHHCDAVLLLGNSPLRLLILEFTVYWNANFNVVSKAQCNIIAET